MVRQKRKQCKIFSRGAGYDYWGQIRAARQAALVPLLQKRHLHLTSKEAGNFELTAYPGLIVKESYWRWPHRNMAGNTIDFFVQVLAMSFHDAM